MDPRFTQLPKSLQAKSRSMTLGDGVPSLVVHSDWENGTSSPIPAVIWMHGRTVNKELDSGRYSRWVRSGIGAVAIDLPGHGARYDQEYMQPNKTLDLIEQASSEIDGVLNSMRALGVFDMSRLAIGGMSAGGMVTLNRLCRPHPFLGTVVEGTTGNLHELYFPSNENPGRKWPVDHQPEDVAKVDPMEHLDEFRPLPLLAIHNEGDRVVPIGTQRLFLDELKAHYKSHDHDPEQIELITFKETGAPEEHAGFGRFANDAKNIQLAFLKRLFRMDA